MNTLIDSHCHLTYEGLADRIDEVVAQAAAVGVTRFVTIATDLAQADKAFELAGRFPSIHVAAGIHPHEAGKVAAGWDEQLAAVIARDDVVAAGEMGLDYHYDFADRPTQQRVFRRQLDLADRSSKPVIIHCRDAHADVLSILAEFPRVRDVVFHCFTGTRAEADEILSRGYWISLTGVVTFKKSHELREVARMLPDDRFMVETDSPYLTPEPFRSVRPNEPSYLIHTASCIARERGLAPDELAAQATQNTIRFFRLADGAEAS